MDWMPSLRPAIPLGRCLALLAVLTVLGSATLWAASPGKWTPSTQFNHWDWRKFWGDTSHAIHMILLPGDGNPYQSRILWWSEEADSDTVHRFRGGEWGWRDTCGSDRCGSVPSNPCFEAISVPDYFTGMNPFCAGHTQLADGRLLVAGGTEPIVWFYGENDSRLFAVGSGSSAGTWTKVDSMAEYRWYPTTTTLGDGRVLVLSGSKYKQHRIFGGRRNGSLPTDFGGDTLSVGDSLYRFAAAPGGGMDKAVIPTVTSSQRPDARESHSLVEMGREPHMLANVLFGGRGTNGVARNDTWFLTRQSSLTGADDSYAWVLPTVHGIPPAKRFDHSAVQVLTNMATNEVYGMVVFGGHGNGDSLYSNVKRLAWNTDLSRLEWFDVITTGTAPSARFGQAAIFDSTYIDSTGVRWKRLIIFGGVSDTSQGPTDADVWELRFNASNPNAATWYRMNLEAVSDRRPMPRYWHTLSMNETLRSYGSGTDNVKLAYMYGGVLPNGTYSDTLWSLYVLKNGKVGWRVMSVGGTSPGGRARHAAVLDPEQKWVSAGRLYISGGDSALGTPADSYVYTVDVWGPGPITWNRWNDMGVTLSGHAAVLEPGAEWARPAEIFTPADSQWTVNSSPPTLLQPYYPPTFVVPGASGTASRVLTVGNEAKSYWIDVPSSGTPSGSWNFHRSIDFAPLTGVSYRPDSIMIAGTQAGGTVIGSTRTLAVSSSMSNDWQTAGSMYARCFHNLVLLPNGKVLVVGGKQTTDEDATGAPYVLNPQIWDPATRNWSTYTDLAAQPDRRGYHSTAILLPDGRVLSAGGDYIPDEYYGDIYCPPYLFKSDSTLATRPIVQCAPKRIAWGQRFTLNVQDSTTLVTRACLIRPAATTHAFDQNQRYVPLTWERADNPPRLFLTAPASPDSAPPGYYMLFVTGSADGTDVPSVARWVRLGGDATRDTCDAIRPDTVALSVDAVSAHSAYLSWTAPADDGSLPASGRAKSFDLRWWGSPINSESSWNAANQVSGLRPPGDVGSYRDTTISGLQNCTWYWFANRVWDDNNLISDLHAEVKAKTTCGGPVPQLGSQSAPLRIASNHQRTQSASTTTSLSSAATVIETRRSPTGGWSVLVRPVAESAGLASPDSSGIVMQVPNGAGGWKRRAHFEPAAGEDVIGLCALRDGNRAVLLGSYALERVSTALESGSQKFALVSASLSASGDALGHITSGDSLDVAPGDSLRLDYEPASTTAATSQPWFALTQRLASLTSPQARLGTRAAPTYQFALDAAHPNPSSGDVSFSFTMAKQGPVSIRIYNVAGRLVRTLVNGQAEPGPHDIVWNAADDGGRRVRAGLYLYRMDAGSWRSQRKVVFLER